MELSLGDYAAYARGSLSAHDDLPLYVFDEDLLDQLPDLAAAYAAPVCFPHDLLAALGTDRPPHRWVLVGPARAGTEPHARHMSARARK